MDKPSELYQQLCYNLKVPPDNNIYKGIIESE